MRNLEKGIKRESLEVSIARIAAAYGFSTTPAQVSKRKVSDLDIDDSLDNGHGALQAALVKDQKVIRTNMHVWGATKRSNTTQIGFTILSSSHTISNALVIKATLSVAEAAGYENLNLLVSTMGDAESKRRFTRELTNFFKKNADILDHDTRALASKNVDAAYRNILKSAPQLVERLPRPIDHLSEHSRKTMTETLAVLEAVGIPYSLEPHLPFAPGVHGELIFAIRGKSKKGVEQLIATGGRIDDAVKKLRPHEQHQGFSIGMSLTVPGTVEIESSAETTHCFVVHVGDVARSRAFSLLEALWKAHISVSQALLSTNMKEQLDAAKAQKAKHVAIIGQREALDGTVLVRNQATQLQTSVPLIKILSALTK